MASGTKQHVGLTLLSTNQEEDGLTAKFDNVTRKGGIMGDVVAKLNGKIGNRALFNSYEEENNPPLQEVKGWGAVTAIDAYADWFMSKDKGAAIMADAGLDLIKLTARVEGPSEANEVDLGFGFRVDTGINVGRQGARVCFFGTGGELIFEELPVPVSCTSRGKDGAKDGADGADGAVAVAVPEETPKEEKPWWKDLKIRGFGVQLSFFKVRFVWA